MRGTMSAERRRKGPITISSVSDDRASFDSLRGGRVVAKSAKPCGAGSSACHEDLARTPAVPADENMRVSRLPAFHYLLENKHCCWYCTKAEGGKGSGAKTGGGALRSQRQVPSTTAHSWSYKRTALWPRSQRLPTVRRKRWRERSGTPELFRGAHP